MTKGYPHHWPDEELRAMAHDETNRTDRRTFLQAGALATASAVSRSPRAESSANNPRSWTSRICS
ncbi:twin-arginine translocation signal domain-containing protein [Singulisphaera rosea]